MIKQLFSILGHPRPMGRLHVVWVGTTMHGMSMGSLGHTLQTGHPRGVDRDVWRGVLSRC